MTKYLAPLLALLTACASTAPRVEPARLSALVVVPGAPDARPLLDEPSSVAAAAGAGPLVVVAAGEASERERTGAFVDVPADACILAYARGGGSVDDLDAAAFADDGAPLAVDDGPDAHPTLLICPPHPARVYLAAVVASGEGLVAVGAQLVPPAMASAVGRAMDAHGTRAAGAHAHAIEAWPGLDDRIRRRHETLGGTWEVVKKLAIGADSRIPSVVPLPLEPDGCTDVMVVPDDDVGALEVETLDDKGRLLARASPTSIERDRVLTICSPIEMTGTVSVRPHVGEGLVAIVVSLAKGEMAKALLGRSETLWVAAREPAPALEAALERELAHAGYSAAAGSQSGTVPLGVLRSLPRHDGEGQCWRFDVVGGAGAAMLSLAAWDSAGRKLAEADGGARATVFACGGGGGRLDVSALARPGTFIASWRKERWADRAFAAHPWAASRMLTRSAVGSFGVIEGDSPNVRSFRIEAAHEATWTSVLAAGKCLRVVAAGEGDGAGLVGRVLDAGSGEELDRSHGRDSVAMRACAPPDAVRTLTVRLEVTGGRLDVVVGERTVSSSPPRGEREPGPPR